MMRGPSWRTLLANELRCYASRTESLGLVVFTLAIVAVTVRDGNGHGESIVRTVLGGPQVQMLGTHMVVGPGWTSFVIGVLYAVFSIGLLDVKAEWVGLTLVRGVTRTKWAGARLAAFAVAALAFLGVILALLGVATITGWWRGPMIGDTAWDVGLWALGLVGVGWFEMAVSLRAQALWPSLAVTVILLGLARFGGAVSPYVPYAQWTVALHHLPGTLSVESGVLYLAVWTVMSGIASLVLARGSVLQAER